MEMNVNNFEGQTIHKEIDHALYNISDAILPEKFYGNKFRIRQWEMELYLAHLKLYNYFSEDKPVNHVENIDVFILANVEA